MVFLLQGCVMSGFLFLLVIDWLTRMTLRLWKDHSVNRLVRSDRVVIPQ